MDKPTNESAKSESLRQEIDAKWNSLQSEIATMESNQAEAVAESDPQYLNLTKRDEFIIRRKIEEFEEDERQGKIKWYPAEEAYKMIMEALHSGKPIQY